MTTVIASERDSTALELLGALIDGEVVLPGGDEWDAARQAWNLAADQHPAAVVFPESAEDVVRLVDHARAAGLRVTTQGTGHFATTLDSLEDTILVRTTRMRGIEIDPVRRRARVEAGVVWAEVSLAAAEHGLAGLAGSAGDVGVVGYTLGGGIGWLGRRYGLAANSVLAVELVTADGRHMRADADHESDLFWAVRGGGGSFGVVTAIEFALYPVAEVYAGAFFFPFERAAEVLDAWRVWTKGTPPELTSAARLMQFPPIPDLPEHLRGRSFVVVEAAFVGSEEAGAELVRPLRGLGPDMDTFATIPASELRHLHMDPPQPVPGAGDGMTLTALSREGIDALVEIAGPGSGSPLLSVELRQLGGGFATASAGHGAVGTLDAEFALFAVGMAPTAAAAAAVKARVAAVKEMLAPWEDDCGYFNFADGPRDGDGLFPPETYRALQAVKAVHDPGELFRASHPVRPARASGL
jgi:hypothetical protein